MYRIKISKLSIIMILTYFLVFVNIAYIPQYNFIKYVSIIIITLYLSTRIRVFLNRRYMLLNIVLLLFCFLVLYNSWITRSLTSSRDSFKSAALFVVSIILTFLVMEYLAYCKKIPEMLNLYYKLTLATVIVTDLLIVFAPTLVYRFNSYYLIGNKFKVSYLHIYLIVFFLFKMRKIMEWRKGHAVILLFYSVLTIGIAVRVNCVTGIVGVLVLVVMYFLFSNKMTGKLIMNPLFYVAILLVCCSFMYVFEIVLSNEIVQDFIVNTLGRSLTLTGRTRIYNKLPELLYKRLWTGYGFGSSYEICMQYGSFPNTQNGIAEWVLQVGLPATVILVVLIYVVIHMLHKSEMSGKAGIPGIFVLYVLAFLASVEVTINLAYFFWLAVLVGIALENEVREWEHLKPN